MSYIGNQPYQAAFVTDTFSGNGSTTAFTMSVAPAGTSSVLVAVTGVLQDPSTYSVTGTTLTFSAAPPSGTGNISVRYLGIPASGVTTTAYRTVTEFTATAGQTTFTPPSYTVGYINVYRNGVLLGSADYTATNGTTVVLAKAATAGDLVVVESFYVSSVLNAISTSGGTIAGNLTINSASGQAPLVVQANGSYGLVTDSSGNVGIGTSSPAAPLDVARGASVAAYTSYRGNGNTSSAEFFVGQGGNNYGYIYNRANGPIEFATNNTTRALIDTNGNFGIGTSSPTNALAIYRGSGVAAFVDLTGNANTAGTSNVVIGQNADDGGYFWNRKSSFLSFGTANTERARIDSSGNWLVGTTSTGYSNSDSFTLEKANGYEIINHTSSRASGSGYILFGYNGGSIGGIVQNGTTAVSYNTTSDYRLKENVQPMLGALAKVTALKPVTYTWKADGSAGQGFIAHELQAVVPECVTGEKDAVETYTDEEGNEQTRPVYQGIDTSFLVATLTAAIQELNAKVEAQAAEIAQLKGQA